MNPLMQRLESITESPVYGYLNPTQQELLILSFRLLYREQQVNAHYPDYAFVVFPIAKSYEGFLKSFLLDLGLIDKHVYASRRFRIGRALNPDIRRENKDEFWLYDDVEAICGKAVARELWDVWLNCRNQIFHYFPNRESQLSLVMAQKYLDDIWHAMQQAVSCQAFSPRLRSVLLPHH